MQEIYEIVAGTKFPASIGLEPSQEAAGIPLATSNIFQGTTKCFATLAELQAVASKLLVPGNDGIVYGDVAELNGHYKLSADMLAWAKVAELGEMPGGENDANEIKGGHHHYGTLAERNAIPLALRRHGMNCSVWEGATQLAADGKLLPREFKLTGLVIEGEGTVDTTEQKQAQLWVREGLETLSENHPDYDPGNPQRAVPSQYYVKASEINADYREDLFLEVIFQGNLTYTYYDARENVPHDFTYEQLTETELLFENEAGAGTRDWTLTAREYIALFVTYPIASPDQLDLMGSGDQSDVWTEVLPGELTIDQELNIESENPIANSVVTNELTKRPLKTEVPSIEQAFLDTMQVGEAMVFTVTKQADGTAKYQAGVGTINKFAPDILDDLLQDSAAGWNGQFITLSGDNSKNQLGKAGQEKAYKRRWYLCKSSTIDSATWERNATVDMLDNTDAYDQSIIAELETETGWNNNIKQVSIKSCKGDEYTSDTGYVYTCYSNDNRWRRIGEPKTADMFIANTGDYISICTALDAHDFGAGVYTVTATASNGRQGQKYYNASTRAMFECVSRSANVMWEKIR